jgi:hypothetical protein
MFEIREVQDRVSKGGMFAHNSTIRLIFGYVKYIITEVFSIVSITSGPPDPLALWEIILRAICAAPHQETQAMQIDPVKKAELAQIFFTLSNAVNDFRLRPDNFHALPPDKQQQFKDQAQALAVRASNLPPMPWARFSRLFSPTCKISSRPPRTLKTRWPTETAWKRESPSWILP